MMLTEFLDKTLEAARQSAQQIYGDDLTELKTIFSEEELTGETNGNGPKNPMGGSSSKTEKKDGVIFERSGNKQAAKHTGPKPELSKKLDSIRKYAAQQSDENVTAFNKQKSTSEANSKKEAKRQGNQLYNRSAIRKQATAQHSKDNTLDELELNNMSPEAKSKKIPLYDRFVENLPDGISQSSDAVDSKPEDIVSKTLEKRLDRLESLIHLALSSPDTAFSQHPLFHKLLHKGVSQKLIKDWFSNIAEQKIHPEQQPELFKTKLEQQICEELNGSTASAAVKFMLFTGRSGSGKTHLAMKLASLPAFMKDRKIAIATFLPESINPQKRYSILKPFCGDLAIDFYALSSAKEADTYSSDWDTYDHVLIDTPALEMDGPRQTENLKELKNRLHSQADTETHYLINTALNGTAFNDPLAKDIEADHIALTHIDQSLKWGKTIQLLANTNYKLRYISSGPAVTGDLLPFDPQKLARKLLRA